MYLLKSINQVDEIFLAQYLALSPSLPYNLFHTCLLGEKDKSTSLFPFIFLHKEFHNVFLADFLYVLLGNLTFPLERR